MNKPRLFIDSDVILDLILQREDHFEVAQNLFGQYQQGKCALFTSSIVLANMHFIIRNLHDVKFANSSILFVNKHFKIVDTNNEDIESAIQSKFSDFEDGVQYFSALRSKKIDVLVTRNIKYYKHAQLPVFTPKQWCLR
jgi:predicted nucleic acid-binding protein